MAILQAVDDEDFSLSKCKIFRPVVKNGRAVRGAGNELQGGLAKSVSVSLGNKRLQPLINERFPPIFLMENPACIR